MGLMKIATYHRRYNDTVEFFKGDLREFLLTRLALLATKKLNIITRCKDWPDRIDLVKQYIKYRHNNILYELLGYTGKTTLAEKWLRHFNECYRTNNYPDEIKYDRVYVTTLFTFYWDITISTILQAKAIARKNRIYVGGVMASIIPDEIEEATGVTPIIGLLDKPGMFDRRKNIVIDSLPLDYSILNEIDYKYAADNAYYGYMTRGCRRGCTFCAVQTLEPEYKNFLPIDNLIRDTNRRFGLKKDLLLLDNNVLDSKEFQSIICQIKKAGFARDSYYVEPNYLSIAVRNLNYNEFAYRKVATELILNFRERLKKPEDINLYDDVLDSLSDYSGSYLTSVSIRKIYKEICVLYEERRNKSKKSRYIDFNQGVDARLLNEVKMKLLSEIAIRPLRIAFDSWSDREHYIKAVSLAAKYEIKHLSNYMLYNYLDKPQELYLRLKLTNDLCEELDIDIYSFPMKYSPVKDENGFHKNRDYIGTHWCKKHIRAIQAILNVTKGQIGRGVSFFNEAFGSSIDEYLELLDMPETYIVYRFLFKDVGLTEKWKNSYRALNENDMRVVKPIIESNNFCELDLSSFSAKLQRLLSHYKIFRGSVKDSKLVNPYKIPAVQLNNIVIPKEFIY